MKDLKKTNQIKAVFFDIDGTLFSHTQKKIPDSAKEALFQLRQKGIRIFIASGRSFQEIHEMGISDFSFDGYVTLNGHLCYNREEELIHKVVMEQEDCKKLVEVFEKKELPMSIVEENQMYINFVDEYVRELYGNYSSDVPPIGKYTGDMIYQLVAYGSPQVVERHLPELSKCKIHFWNGKGCDILHSDSGKGTSIEKILPFYQLSKEEIMVIGDGENDIDMIAFAEMGVAMGNAEEVVKEHADYVTTHIDEDGIKNALLHFGLIE